MDNFESHRLRMVDHQIRRRGIKDPYVLAAMETVERHLFVSPNYVDGAYEDHPIPIGHDQTISQPYMVAIMTDLLNVQPEDKVLEIGTGSGYQAAILAYLADWVVTVERIAALAELAEETFKKIGLVNIEVHVSDGTVGWPPSSPYNKIIVTAGAPRVPKSLTDQLAEGGKLVIPVGNRSVQDLILVDKKKGRLIESKHGGCRFVKLIGEEGWR